MADKARSQSKDALKGVRVLILDDEEMIRTVVSKSLRHCGAEVEAASDGREGLQALIDRYFDVLVVDLCMPNMDGITFLQEALKIWPWLGVVVVTGYGGDNAYQRIRDQGVTRMLEKPFEQSVLIQNIAEEYRDKQQNAKNQQTVALSKMQQQLQILRLITEPALQAGTLLEALRSLSIELSRLLDFAVVGVFACEQEQNAVIFHVREPVQAEFIHDLTERFRTRYAALTGHDIPESLRVELKGAPTDASGASGVGRNWSVPIMTGGEVKGFLLLASVDSDDLEVGEVAFIYNIANHLSTVFAALSRMRSLAIHDPMTGLYNRLHLEAEVRDVWSWCVRYGRPVAIAIMDIDHFKQINDTYGHSVGDQVLEEFAGILGSSGRESDIVGRYGGEEFIVLLPNAGRQDALTYAERFLDRVRQHVFCKGGHNLRLTVSIGISVATKEKMEDTTSEKILEEADKAMYGAKHAGRNCIRVWSDLRDSTADSVPESGVAVPDRTETEDTVPARLLLVDDDDDVRRSLEMMLKREGYETTGVANAEEAVAAMKEAPNTYDLLLVDIVLSGMSGLELLNEARSLDDTIVCIMISGYATTENAIESLRNGAYDFIRKPCVREEVLLTVRRAMEYRQAILQNRQYQRHLADMVQEKSARTRQALREVKASYEFTLEALVGLLDAREKDTGNHSRRVRSLVLRLAKQTGLPDDQLKDLGYGALLHDVGKIGIPDRVLLKQGPLNHHEWAIMRRHPEIGYRVLSGSGYLKNAAEIVYSHHEAYDGSGYPRNLPGSDICLGARLFAVVDAYDAMRTRCVYRRQKTAEEAVAEIRAMRGTQFDPFAVDAFLQCYHDLATIFDEWGRRQADGEDQSASAAALIPAGSYSDAS